METTRDRGDGHVAHKGRGIFLVYVDIDVHQKNPSAFVCHVSVPSVACRFHRVASSRVHPPSRLKPLQDEHKLGSPLRTPCTPPRPPYARWGEGSAPRST